MFLVTKHSYSKPWTWTDTLVQLKQRKGDLRFGTWNVGACIGQVHVQQQLGNEQDIN